MIGYISDSRRLAAAHLWKLLLHPVPPIHPCTRTSTIIPGLGSRSSHRPHHTIQMEKYLSVLARRGPSGHKTTFNCSYTYMNIVIVLLAIKSQRNKLYLIVYAYRGEIYTTNPRQTGRKVLIPSSRQTFTIPRGFASGQPALICTLDIERVDFC